MQPTLSNIRHALLWCLLFTFFLSITIFEAFVVIYLLVLLYDEIKNKNLKGILTAPIFTYIIPGLISSILFNISKINHAIEELVFMLLYLAKNYLDIDYMKFAKTVNLYLTILGLPLSFIALYNLKSKGYEMILFGGAFDSGFIFSMIAFSSIGIFLYKKDWKRFLFLGLFLLYSLMVVFSTKRSDLLGFLAGLSVFLSASLGSYSKKLVLSILAASLLVLSIGGFYVFRKDPRFDAIVKILKHEKITTKELNTVSSLRYKIMIHALKVIRNDIRNKNIPAILIGHGVRSGVKLDPKLGLEKFESFEAISEYIEKGLIGLIGLVWFYWRVLKFSFSLKALKEEDFLFIPFVATMVYQLFGSLFTFFWSLYLPLILLLFGIAENYYEKR
ncbi:MAG: hypothetical protein ACP5UF_00615 [Hydrogenobaculum sp.]